MLVFFPVPPRPDKLWEIRSFTLRVSDSTADARGMTLLFFVENGCNITAAAIQKEKSRGCT